MKRQPVFTKEAPFTLGFVVVVTILGHLLYHQVSDLVRPPIHALIERVAAGW